MRVRYLTAADMPKLADLYRCFWNEDSNVEKMKDQFQKLQTSNTHILLGAEENGLLIGSVMGVVCEEFYGDCRPFLVLENMIVDPNFRRSGAGKALLAFLEEEARKRNCTQIILVTEKNRADACSFYEACGFQTENTGYKKKL